jgi:hypothetical protein
MRAYTVVDEYIVTKEDGETFDVFFADDGSQPMDAAQVDYVCKRYMLLRFDMLRQKYEQYLDTFSAGNVALKGWDDPSRAALDEDGAILPGTEQHESLLEIITTLQTIKWVMSNFSPKNVLAYREGSDVATVAMNVQDIPRELEQLKAGFIRVLPPHAFDPIAVNAQNIFRFAEYYTNLILTLIDRELRNSRPVQVGIFTVENGVPQLTSGGAGLYQQMIAYLRTNDESVPITSSIMSQQVLIAAMLWITSNRPGADAAKIQLILGKQLQLAQANVAGLGLPPGGGRRKTHRRRGLPKLI